MRSAAFAPPSRRLGIAGAVGRLVDADLAGLEPAAGPGEELLDPQLRIVEEPLAVPLERDRALRPGDRLLERQAAGLQLLDRLPQLGERRVERQCGNLGVDRCQPGPSSRGSSSSLARSSG